MPLKYHRRENGALVACIRATADNFVDVVKKIRRTSIFSAYCGVG
jgi:hypothetical protein